jgi:oligoendopeptidase F
MTLAEKKLTGAEAIRWDLGDLYHAYDDPRIEADMQASTQQAKTFAERYYGKVAGLNAPELLEAMQALESIYTLLTKLGSYAQMIWSVETQNPDLGKLRSKIQEHYTAIHQVILFFGLEWANAPESSAQLTDDPRLERYGHYLKIERLYQPYILSEPEEKIVSQMALTGANAWTRYFGEVTSAFKFPYEGRDLTMAEIMTLIKDPNRETRRQAAEVITEVLQANQHSTSFVMNMVLLDKMTQDKLRGYPSWISSRNLSNQVDDATVETLIEAVTGRYDIVSRYYALLKKQLGVDELYDYDRYAPIEEVKTEVAWEQAQATVLTAFAEFDPRMAQIAQEFFDKRWIDAPPQVGKRSGAYCASTTVTAHPYIFLNYDGTVDSVMTLAHELGHGIHGYLARPQGEMQADTPLTTAEMASTFCEMVVFDYLIARENDPKVRLAMRMDKVADTFATIFRQVSMNRFEHYVHTSRRESGELSTEQISDLWMQSQQPMFGQSLHLRDQYRIWWSYIPHFLNTPGYVYAYAFGELLVWALYARYQADSAGFADRYLNVLALGGSNYPHKILAPMGVNLQDPHFWHEGLGLLDDFLKQTEADAAAL